MNYLIICRTNGKHYLLMTRTSPRQVQGFDSKENVMKAFSGYTEGWTGQGYERSMSCTIGMMNMNPVAIEAPENPEDLREYILDMRACHIAGGALGSGYFGLEIKEEILKFKQFEIWKESMKIAGIK